MSRGAQLRSEESLECAPVIHLPTLGWGVTGAAVVRVRSRLVFPAEGLSEGGAGSAVAVTRARTLAVGLGLGGGKQAEAAERHQTAKEKSAHGWKEWVWGHLAPEAIDWGLWWEIFSWKASRASNGLGGLHSLAEQISI